ncbi:MAG: hypothetical protein ABIQ60_14925 [Burkholderiaceae bacterium]
MKTQLIALLIVPSLHAMAQSNAPAMPTEFPADAAPLSASELRDALSGKVYRARIANGDTWRLEYKPNGYYFVDVSNGYRASGTWYTEDGKLCGERRDAPMACSEMRRAGDVLYMKRASSGEVVALNRQ